MTFPSSDAKSKLNADTRICAAKDPRRAADAFHPRASALIRGWFGLAFLFELDQHDLRPGAHAHGRAPGAGAVRRVYLQAAQRLQTVDELSPDAARDPGVRKEL